MIREKKLVQIGAGKIGRSFIGQLFSRSGYEVVFIDVFKPVVDALNSRRKYKVVIKSDRDEFLLIENVRGVLASDRSAAIEEISTAGIVSVSTGMEGLPGVIDLLAGGLTARHVLDKEGPLDIIIAENMRNAERYFKENLRRELPLAYPFDRLVGLIETSIGKMVPLMTPEDMEGDILKVFAEPYNTLILDKKGFKNKLPDVLGLAPKDNIKAWVDRKLFIHNFGHASAAYFGHIHDPSLVYLYEVLQIKEVYRLTRAAMLQAAHILQKLYPEEFTRASLENHVDDLLKRFQNRSLKDTVFRVGTGLRRKLGPEDRILSPLKAAVQLSLPYDRIVQAMISGFHFRARDQKGNRNPEDAVVTDLFLKNPDAALSEICGLEKEIYPAVYQQASTLDADILHTP
jgi:mannitol-1-phosphate 5-dehydrogenase